MFDDYRGAVDALVIRRGELERQIAEQLPLSPGRKPPSD